MLTFDDKGGGQKTLKPCLRNTWMFPKHFITPNSYFRSAVRAQTGSWSWKPYTYESKQVCDSELRFIRPGNKYLLK